MAYFIMLAKWVDIGVLFVLRSSLTLFAFIRLLRHPMNSGGNSS